MCVEGVQVCAFKKFKFYFLYLSTFTSYLMLKSSLLKNVNIITWLEFELADFKAIVHHVSHYSTYFTSFLETTDVDNCGKM